MKILDEFERGRTGDIKDLCLRSVRIKIWAVEIELKKILAQRHKRHIIDARRVPSAVLVPIYYKQGQYHIVFIKRTETVKVHKGQISFPGGNRDTHDRTPLDTALREATEEIGLRTQDVEVLGELDDEVTTTSNYIVTPFAALMPWPYRFKKSRTEVAEIIRVPIRVLLRQGCLKPTTEILDGKTVDSYTYHYQEKVIWGATARILNKLLDIVNPILP
jgi:8-oxo-dGTP pyrophosphatase MutT (NUDIX family)